MSEVGTRRRITHDGGRLGSERSLCGKTMGADVVATFDKSSSVVEIDIDWGRSLDRGATFSCNMDGETSLSNPLMVSVR